MTSRCYIQARQCVKYDHPCKIARDCCSFAADPNCVVCRPRYRIFGAKVCARSKRPFIHRYMCEDEDSRRYRCGGDGHRCGRK